MIESPRLKPLLTGAFLLTALGIPLRLIRFAQNWPLWWNEAFVAVNLFSRDYLGLLRPLDYRQICPIGFLWAEKVLVQRLGPSEWALRLLPLVASLAALLSFTRITIRLPRDRAGLIALALLAVAYHPIQLGSELKPYSLDLLAAVLILERALAWSRSPALITPLIQLSLLTPILMFLSYPSALVLAGTAAALAIPAWRTRDLRARSAFAAWSLILALSAFAVFRLSASGQSQVAAGDSLNEYLRDGFPASGHPADLGRWLASVATGRLFAFPFGDPGLPSLIGLAFAAFGAITLGCRHRTLFLILFGPLAATLAAAMLRLYPLGGHPRVSQHLMPSLALAIGFGLDTALSTLRPQPNPRRLRLAAVAALLLIGGLPLARDFAHPYRTNRDRAARDFARDFWPAIHLDNAHVVCLRRDLNLLPADSPNPDVALYLANRVLYSPPTRTPPAGRFRYVLYYAPGIENPETKTLLEILQPPASPIQQTRIDLPDHGQRGGCVEVFEYAATTPPPGMPLAQSLQSKLVR